MKCDDVRFLLVDDVRGELDPAVASQVRGHAEKCEACRAMRDEMAGTLGVLEAGFKAAKNQDLKLDDLHRGRIMLSRKRSSGEGRWFLRAAALVVLVGGLAGLMLPALSSSRKMAIRANVRHEMKMLEMSRSGVDASVVNQPQGQVIALDCLMAIPSDQPVAVESPTPENVNGDVGGVVSRTAGGRSAAMSAYGGGGARTRQVVSGTVDDRKSEMPAEVVVKEEMAKTSVDSGVARGFVSGKPGSPPAVRGKAKREGRSSLPREDMAVPASWVAGQPYAAGAVHESGAGGGGAAGESSSYEVESEVVGQEVDSRTTPIITKSPLIIKGVAASGAKSGYLLKRKTVESKLYASVRNKARPSNETEAFASMKSVDQPMMVAAAVGRKDDLKRLLPIDKAEKVADSSVANGMVAMEKLQLASDSDGFAYSEPIDVPVNHNRVVDTKENSISTFAIDVDTASFTLARRALLGGKLPALASVRVEEFINAFDQDYPPPEKRSFAVYADRSRSPFRPGVELVRIGVRGKVLGRDQQKPSVLTLVVDTSGSMNTPDRIGLMKQAIRMLADGLGPSDRLAIVTFGSGSRLVLDMTPMTDKAAVLAAVAGLETQGSTHLEGGLRLGYETAARHFGSGCLNRVILLSDGVANLGAATADEILKQVESYRKQGVYCSVYGFGQGTYNDVMLESLADKGDGVYRFIDSQAEVRRAFVDDLSASFQVIAKIVKIQVEFDPKRVKSYRQLGYENRQLTTEQFRDDRVDAGEVGSGQSATALYEVELAGDAGDALGEVRVRWQDVATAQVQELAESIQAGDKYADFGAAPVRFRLTAGVAELAGVLRGDPISMETGLSDIAAVLRSVGLEMKLDRQVQDLVRMVNMATRLKK